MVPKARSSARWGLATVLLLAWGSAWADTFDFRLERNSDLITVPQGFGGINTLHATLVSGGPQDVTISGSELPSGASVAFAPAVITFDREGGLSPHVSTLTVSVLTSSSTPLGRHRVTLTGTSGASVRTTSFVLEVVSVPGNRKYYVSVSGNDGNPGTQSEPFRTIQRGVDAASPGDTVVVEAGEYHERVRLNHSGTAGSPITLLGRPGAIIDGNQRITGWQPAPEIAAGVFKKPLSQMPFTPGAIAYQGKYALWLWWDSIPGCCGPAWRWLQIPQDDPLWDAVGAYGYADANHGIDDGNPPPPDTSSHTAYVRLKTGGNPDNEEVTFADADQPTIAIESQNYITIHGFVIRNGFGPVMIHNGTGNVIEHNFVQGGSTTISVDQSDQTIIRNNEATLNHYYGEMPTADKNRITYQLLLDLRHWNRYHRSIVIGVARSTDTKIYQNHVSKSLCGICFIENTNDIEISNNYLHHFNDYAVASHIDYPATVFFHDNLLYELGLEGWRADVTHNGARMYVYRNRFYNLTHICEPGGYHGGSCGDNDMEFGASDAVRYWYHNSFIGSTAITPAGYYQQSSGGGLPNTWIINNIFSSDWLFGYDEYEPWFVTGPRWHFDYNWIGEDRIDHDITLLAPLLRNYTHNSLHENMLMWDKVNPSFVATGDAVQAGIDISRPWTMDGVDHPALPGMTPGYFSGAAPDLGWFSVEASPGGGGGGSSGNGGSSGSGGSSDNGAGSAHAEGGCSVVTSSMGGADSATWITLALLWFAWRAYFIGRRQPRTMRHATIEPRVGCLRAPLASPDRGIGPGKSSNQHEA